MIPKHFTHTVSRQVDRLANTGISFLRKPNITMKFAAAVLALLVHSSLAEMANDQFARELNGKKGQSPDMEMSLEGGKKGGPPAATPAPVDPCANSVMAADNNLQLNSPFSVRTFDILRNDSVMNGCSAIDPSTVSIVKNPGAGTIAINSDGSVVYTRTDNFPPRFGVNIDMFIYSVCNDSGCDTATVIIAVYDSYSGVQVNFDNRRLYALMQGDELHRHLAVQDNVQSTVAFCFIEKSENYGQVVPRNECSGVYYQGDTEDSSGQRSLTSFEAKPWAFPNFNGTTLLASDPGIWSIEHFITEDEADQLLDLMQRNGNCYSSTCLLGST
jgi:hypothetical protein